MIYFPISPKHTFRISNEDELSDKEIAEIRSFDNMFISPYHEMSGVKPTIDPFKNLVFKTNQKPKDIYQINDTLSRGFIVSPRFKEILSQKNLPAHYYFSKIKYLFKDKFLEDYYFLFIYESVYDKIDFTKSTFKTYNKRDNLKVRTTLEDSNFIIDRNLRFSEKKEFDEYQANLFKTSNSRIWFQNVVTKSHEQYDIVTFYQISNYYWLFSEKLIETITKSKLSGFDFLEFPISIDFTNEEV